jgi:MFS family permease
VNEPGTARRLHYGWVIAALSAVAVVGALGFGRFGYTVILPAMKDGLGIGDVQAADLATGTMLGYLLLSVLGGILAARFGSRLIITLFLALTCISMALTGFAPSYGGALVARTLTGIGSGGVNVPVMALTAIWFARRRRGMAMGITVSGSSIGLLITGLVIPPIVARFGADGWRWGWYLLAALTGAITVLCGLLLRDRPEDLGLRPLGAEGGGEAPQAPEPARGARRPEAPGEHLRTARGAEGSGAAARRPSASVLDWRLVYRSRKVWHLAALYSAFGFSYVIYATFFVRHLTGESGISLQRAGSLWSLVGLVSVASGFAWGTVSDRLGRRFALALVFVLQTASFLSFGLWREPAGFLLSALLFSLTAWSVPALMAAAVGDFVEPRLAPAVFGFISLFLSTGQVAGPFVAGRIAAAAGSFSLAFVTAGLAALAGAIGSLFLASDRAEQRAAAPTT